MIYITAFAGDETLQRAKITEPYGYILKPFNNRELRNCIEIALCRRGAEKRLHETETKYQQLFENIAEPVFIFDRGTNLFLDCNRSALDRYGYTLDELKKMTPFDLHPAEELEIVEENILDESDLSSHEYTHITKDEKK